MPADFFLINDETTGEPLANVYYEIKTKSGRETWGYTEKIRGDEEYGIEIVAQK